MGCLDTEGDWIEHQSVLPPIPLYTFSTIEWMNGADEVVSAVYRTNTFPLVHAGFFHAFMNIVALTPLLERFEAEYGTLTTLALFLGREHSSTSIERFGRRADRISSSIHYPGAAIYFC